MFICLLSPCRANADLTKRLRAVQEELIVSRREHAAVIAVNAQLEARIAELEREVNKARSSRRRRSTSAQYDDDIQRQPAMHATDLHTMQANLANVILQLRGMHALCYQAACPPQEAQCEHTHVYCFLAPTECISRPTLRASLTADFAALCTSCASARPDDSPSQRSATSTAEERSGDDACVPRSITHIRRQPRAFAVYGSASLRRRR